MKTLADLPSAPLADMLMEMVADIAARLPPTRERRAARAPVNVRRDADGVLRGEHRAIARARERKFQRGSAGRYVWP